MSDTLRRQSQAAQAVHEIIDSEQFRKAMERLEALYIAELLSTKPHRNYDDLRQRRQQKIEVLRGFRAQLEAVLRDGQIADHHLTEIDKAKDRRFLW